MNCYYKKVDLRTCDRWLILNDLSGIWLSSIERNRIIYFDKFQENLD